MTVKNVFTNLNSESGLQRQQAKPITKLHCGLYSPSQFRAGSRQPIIDDDDVRTAPAFRVLDLKVKITECQGHPVPGVHADRPHQFGVGRVWVWVVGGGGVSFVTSGDNVSISI